MYVASDLLQPKSSMVNKKCQFYSRPGTSLNDVSRDRACCIFLRDYFNRLWSDQSKQSISVGDHSDWNFSQKITVHSRAYFSNFTVYRIWPTWAWLHATRKMKPQCICFVEVNIHQNGCLAILVVANKSELFPVYLSPKTSAKSLFCLPHL